jgi:molybdate transport system ATP-binding protein
MQNLPNIDHFIKEGETWAIVGDSNSGHTDVLRQLHTARAELVSYKHRFRNLSNTTDFYYQQRFNSCDSDDSLTVHEYLVEQQAHTGSGYWNYGRVVRELNLHNLLSEQLIKLSNGETKRLLIAAALIRNPTTLLLDHPLTGLDMTTRGNFSSLLEHILDSGIHVVITTGPFEIPAAVTHVAVIKDRTVAFQGRVGQYRAGDFDFEKPREVDRALLSELMLSEEMPVFDIIIRMTDVNVTYDGRRILSHITWQVKQGDRWAISGPNGAGKSTLLSLINGDNPQAYANNIMLFDRQRGSGESIWDIKKMTGFVSPELYQYFPMESSCLHVIESGFYDTIGLFRPPDPVKEEICIKWMTMFGAEKYAHRLFSMVPLHIQRLCLLSRALVKNPVLLILDEPTQGLDDAEQKFFTALIDELCNITRVTLLYVSHYEQHIPNAVTKRMGL